MSRLIDVLPASHPPLSGISVGRHECGGRPHSAHCRVDGVQATDRRIGREGRSQHGDDHRACRIIDTILPAASRHSRLRSPRGAEERNRSLDRAIHFRRVIHRARKDVSALHHGDERGRHIPCGEIVA